MVVGGSGLVGWLILGFGYGCRQWWIMVVVGVGSGGGVVLWAVVVVGCVVYITV